MATKTRELADFILEEGIGGDADIAIQGRPHIQPGVLQPAVAGKLLNGATHSGAYGTAQTQSGGDGRSYYYTDIKGSKPIKDPRIGAHFGSQRHKTKSIQLLEQETATHGKDVHSIDGREWMRAVGTGHTANNTNKGSSFQWPSGTCDGDFIEIVGYFNDANLIFYTDSNKETIEVHVDGGTVQANDFALTVETPLTSRYVDAGSVANLSFNGGNPTLGIHTLKLVGTGSNPIVNIYGIELIAQDTTSTATKSQIQIPSQNVVSYGKKFTVSGTPHYNPFAFKTDGTTAWASGAHNGTSWPVGTGSSANIDTATSLGLANWLHSSNYYKPYNGGRVVVWVASDGTIKTSVNVMPPNAQNVSGSAISAKANASIANDTYLPTFSGAIDHSQAEVAKTFNWREFGNGAANGGTGNAYYADLSMLTTSFDDVAYVMDDGLTSFSANDIKNNGENPDVDGTGGYAYITFIGTGFTTSGVGGAEHIVQNLPYGTHILKFGNADILCDGIEVHTNLEIIDNSNKATEYTFYQPKKPPIPEDAVVLADYMLMADYVVQTDAEFTQISKGVRAISSTRDVFFNGNYATAFQLDPGAAPFGMSAGASHGSTTTTVALPFFGTNVDIRNESGTTAFNGGSNVTQTDLDSSGGGGVCDMKTIASPGITLGVNNVVHSLSTGGYRFLGYQVVTPIHTSSHYQTFETPYLHELVGGDRNMEQTNLVVTADGKTWNEVTRDTSYIGNTVLFVRDHEGWNSNQDWSIQRGGGNVGNPADKSNMVFKDSWANGYDRWICLKAGYYICFGVILIKENTHYKFLVNGVETYNAHSSGLSSGIHDAIPFNFSHYFQRGDTLQGSGQRYGDIWSYVNIVKQGEVE